MWKSSADQAASAVGNGQMTFRSGPFFRLKYSHDSVLSLDLRTGGWIWCLQMWCIVYHYVCKEVSLIMLLLAKDEHLWIIFMHWRVENLGRDRITLVIPWNFWLKEREADDEAICRTLFQHKREKMLKCMFWLYLACVDYFNVERFFMVKWCFSQGKLTGIRTVWPKIEILSKPTLGNIPPVMYHPLLNQQSCHDFYFLFVLFVLII